MHDVLSLILGGGRGARLYPLTRDRSEPAVPIAGKYRLIDIPVSNCLNHGLNRIYVLTQYLSTSLHRHIASTYKFSPFGRGFVEILAAQQTNETADWYQGTADAIRQNLRYVQADECGDVLILSGDQLYRMDLDRLVREHRERRADVTVAVAPVAAEPASRLGVVRLDEHDRLVGLVEKPDGGASLAGLRAPAEWLRRRGAAAGRDYLANMGIYLFAKEALLDLLRASPSAHDLVSGVLLPNLAKRHIYGHLFTGYWEDVGTIRAYHAANLALAGDQPPFDFHSPQGVIYTRTRNLPASRCGGARMDHALVSDGCRIAAGARLERCVLGVRSVLGKGVVLRDVVMLGADELEDENDRPAGQPPLGVGEGSVVERAILDRDCRVGKRVRIVNQKQVEQADGPNYVIREGIVVIPNGAVVPDGTVI
jgi:glucose-1-phosphate adenylyltransferase